MLTYYLAGFAGWVIFCVLLCFLFILVHFIVRKLESRYVRLAHQDHELFAVEDGAETLDAPIPVSIPRWVRILRSLVLWGTPICISLALLALSVFDIIAWYASSFIICGFFLIYWLYFSGAYLIFWSTWFGNGTDEKQPYGALVDNDPVLEVEAAVQPSSSTELKTLLIRQVLPLFVLFIFIFFITWFFSGLCFGWKPISASFKGTRRFSSDPCPHGVENPCHVYLNVGSNSSSTMVIVFHTTAELASPMVRVGKYAGKFEDYAIVQAGKSKGKLDLEVERYVYVAYLQGLEPFTTYYFIAGNGINQKSYTEVRKFRTTAAHSKDNPIRWTAGGDVGLLPMSERMLQVNAALEPDFVMIGGDIAYANGMKTCYRRWDHWLHMWNKFSVSPKGYTLPMLTSIGNHEAGGFHSTRNNAPFYLNYFFHEPEAVPTPQVKSLNEGLFQMDSIINSLDSTINSGSTMGSTINSMDSTINSAGSIMDSEMLNNFGVVRNTQTLPPEYATFHVHYIGESTVLVLDTDIIAPSGGEQAEFISKHLNESIAGNSTWRMALYHSPLYPSRRSGEYSSVKTLRKNWGPLFDKHGLDIAFENHDHAYKRTYPLYQEAKVPIGKGTVYLGDGAMGVDPRAPGAIRKHEYLAITEAQNFVFSLVMTPHNITLKAINDKNEQFDYYLFTPKDLSSLP